MCVVAGWSIGLRRLSTVAHDSSSSPWQLEVLQSKARQSASSGRISATQKLAICSRSLIFRARFLIWASWESITMFRMCYSCRMSLEQTLNWTDCLSISWGLHWLLILPVEIVNFAMIHFLILPTKSNLAQLIRFQLFRLRICLFIGDTAPFSTFLCPACEYNGKPWSQQTWLGQYSEWVSFWSASHFKHVLENIHKMTSMAKRSIHPILSQQGKHTMFHHEWLEQFLALLHEHDHISPTRGKLNSCHPRLQNHLADQIWGFTLSGFLHTFFGPNHIESMMPLSDRYNLNTGIWPRCLHLPFSFRSMWRMDQDVTTTSKSPTTFSALYQVQILTLFSNSTRICMSSKKIAVKQSCCTTLMKHHLDALSKHVHSHTHKTQELLSDIRDLETSGHRVSSTRQLSILTADGLQKVQGPTLPACKDRLRTVADSPSYSTHNISSRDASLSRLPSKI